MPYESNNYNTGFSQLNLYLLQTAVKHLWWLIWPIQNDEKTEKMIETLAHGYSPESTRRELSNEYQHSRVKMVLKDLCLFVRWNKVALALEGLRLFDFVHQSMCSSLKRMISRRNDSILVTCVVDQQIKVLMNLRPNCCYLFHCLLHNCVRIIEVHIYEFFNAILQ